MGHSHEDRQLLWQEGGPRTARDSQQDRSRERSEGSTGNDQPATISARLWKLSHQASGMKRRWNLNLAAVHRGSPIPLLPLQSHRLGRSSEWLTFWNLSPYVGAGELCLCPQGTLTRPERRSHRMLGQLHLGGGLTVGCEGGLWSSLPSCSLKSRWSLWLLQFRVKIGGTQAVGQRATWECTARVL